jgi:hypothetical protein
MELGTRGLDFWTSRRAQGTATKNSLFDRMTGAKFCMETEPNLETGSQPVVICSGCQMPMVPALLASSANLSEVIYRCDKCEAARWPTVNDIGDS